MKKFTPKTPKLCPSCPNVDLTLDEPVFNFKAPEKPTTQKKTIHVVDVKKKGYIPRRETLF